MVDSIDDVIMTQSPILTIKSESGTMFRFLRIKEGSMYERIIEKQSGKNYW